MRAANIAESDPLAVAKGAPLASDADSLIGLQRFDGTAPETINGRLAMVGVVTALVAELWTHTTVGEQFYAHPVPIIGTFLLFIAASYIPMVKGEDKEKWQRGPFTRIAEMTNGRVAMLGWSYLLILEWYNRVPMVPRLLTDWAHTIGLNGVNLV